MTTPEYRSLLEPVEFRSSGGKLVAAGVAMRYGTKSTPIRGKFRETFAPGSYARSIKGADIRSHNEHFGGYLGRTGNGTVRVTDTRSELAYEIDIPDTTAGRDAAFLLERGDTRGASVAFVATPTGQTWGVDSDGMALRSISDADLMCIDLTVAPYYDDTTAEVALRSFAETRDLELRSVLDACRSGQFATLLDPETPAPESDADEISPEEAVIVRPILLAL